MAIFCRIVTTIFITLNICTYGLALTPTGDHTSRRSLFTKALVAVTTATAASTVTPANAQEATEEAIAFRRIPTQFIAALGDATTNHGTGAQNWGLWTVDPGPRGVWLRDAKSLIESGVGPYGWKFDSRDWWVEEHGLIMESPDFPLSPGTYRVTGGREMTAVLTISSTGDWSLKPYGNTETPSLYDVTHLPCRSARYTPTNAGGKSSSCSPLKANKSKFPVRPGGVMPSVSGCAKQDYAVLFVTGIATSNAGEL